MVTSTRDLIERLEHRVLVSGLVAFVVLFMACIFNFGIAWRAHQRITAHGTEVYGWAKVVLSEEAKCDSMNVVTQAKVDSILRKLEEK
jgi:hypothetical protein